MFKVSNCLPTTLPLFSLSHHLFSFPFLFWSNLVKDLRGIPGYKVLALLHYLGIIKPFLSGLLQSDLLAGPSLSLRKTLWSLSLSSPGDLPSGSLRLAFQPPSG